MCESRLFLSCQEYNIPLVRTRAVVSLCDVILSGIQLKQCNQNKNTNKSNGLTGLELIGMTIMAMCTLSLL
jgi:hypothetical protein